MRHRPLPLRCLAVGLLFAAVAQADPREVFAPWLVDEAPEIVEVVEQRTTDGIEITRLKFLSRTDRATGEPVVIYGVLARPTAPGRKPAVLVCHGGGASADGVAAQVIGWAKRGYVSFCQDEPGICGSGHRSSGPWEKRSRFDASGGADTVQLFDGVLAGVRGLALLRCQPDVDTSRVGVTGGSWGGYMTSMVTGLAGDRVQASFSVYGCGYYDLGSAWTETLMKLDPAVRETWLNSLDAGRVAAKLSATHFVASPTNDWFFWPNAVMRTLAEVRGHRNQCFMPNESHMLSQPGGMAGPPAFDRAANRTYLEIAWLDHYLRGVGEAFPACDQPQVVGREMGGLRVRWHAAGTRPFTRWKCWWAAGELIWRVKWWAEAPVEPEGDGWYTAVLPIDEPDLPIHWFGLVTDDRGISVSTLIEAVEPVAHGITAADCRMPGFAQGFEEPDAKARWQRRYGDRRPGRHRILAEAARSGQFGLELNGELSLACSGLRGATLQRLGAIRISFWARAAAADCPAPTLDLLTENWAGAQVVWAVPDLPPLTLTSQWQRIEVPLASFQPTGGRTPFGPLFGPELGQLRLNATAAVHCYVDDIQID